MRKPGISVEESPSMPPPGKEERQESKRLAGQEFDLDLTTIQHQRTASDLLVKDLFSKDKAFFSLNEENKSGDED